MAILAECASAVGSAEKHTIAPLPIELAHVCSLSGEGAPRPGLMITFDSGTHAEVAGWWRKGAEQGQGKGQHQLGFAYALGDGVPGDDVAGWAWSSVRKC
jgi:TPR repeat protein